MHLPLRRVEFHILLSLAAGERHGYGIIQDIEARGETSVPDVGTMYRALARMVEAGLIEASARRPAPDDRRRAPQLLPHHERRSARRARRGAAAGRADAGRAARRPARQRESNDTRSPDATLGALVHPSAAAVSAPTSATKWVAPWSRPTWIARATRGTPAARSGSSFLWVRALARLAAQRRRRANAPGGFVAARRQLGPRCRARDAAARARSGLCRGHGRHADDRARHVRGRVHGGAEDSDRPDALQGSGRSVLRLARLRPIVDLPRGDSAAPTSPSCRRQAASSRTLRGCSAFWAAFSRCGKAPNRWKSP